VELITPGDANCFPPLQFRRVWKPTALTPHSRCWRGRRVWQPQRGEVDPSRERDFGRMGGALVAHRYGTEGFERHLGVLTSG
jgi:hypothetical protein